MAGAEAALPLVALHCSRYWGASRNPMVAAGHYRSYYSSFHKDHLDYSCIYPHFISSPDNWPFQGHYNIHCWHTQQAFATADYTQHPSGFYDNHWLWGGPIIDIGLLSCWSPSWYHTYWTLLRDAKRAIAPLQSTSRNDEGATHLA